MIIRDTVSMGGVYRTDEGYLLANVRASRSGIQQYMGAELGRPEMGMVNVYRPEAEVFSRRSLDTFSKLPITLDHPASPVDITNWRQLAVGVTGDEVLRDGEHLKVGLKITDIDAVRTIEAGKRDLSVGYEAEIVWQDGIAPDGTPYQAVQKNIRANHIAVVDQGRARTARIGDSVAVDDSAVEAARAAYMARLTRRATPVHDNGGALVVDSHAAYTARLTRREAPTGASIDDSEAAYSGAHAAYVDRLTRKGRNKAVRDSGVTPTAWMK